MRRYRLAFALVARASARVGALGGASVVAGCASVTPTPAALTQAQALYASLEAKHADQHVEGDMIRARASIDTARAAVTQGQNGVYVAGVADIALRTVQIADAHFGRTLANFATDSLQKLRLTRQLAAAQVRQATLEAQRADLERQTAVANARADSLRQAADAANAQLGRAMAQLQSLVVEVTDLKETARGLVISLSDILFDPGKASLKPGAEANVRKISAVLSQYPDRKISVEGYTDSTGSDSFNQLLSEGRAAAVRSALIAGGLDSASIAAHGFGKADPVATNTTPDGRQQNRRVEIVVLGAGKLADLLESHPGTPPPATSGGAAPEPRALPGATRTALPPPDSARTAADSTRHP